jgi:hypothetical protein
LIHSRTEYSEIMLNELLISIAACKLEIWEHLKVEISLGVVWNWNGWNSLWLNAFFEKKVRYIHMPSRGNYFHKGNEL